MGWRPAPPVPPGGSQSVKGVKLGFRVDLEYKVTNHLAAVATFQAVELGVDAPGTGSLNPSWFQAGARWRF
ncbi:hypothetical protein [Geothrix sp. PMB-07]|uniref:hypothetical protein n=1 Tax=Geothrix sp. PMB-07 TaxID=3068640 RepID=UPI0027403CE3|nr:hypothetical protein [Geothrix sp. PMB-07]WLT30737.1 hypothetical protein Q9293_13530 [Geothrix sp. PMB-07]